MKKTAYPLLLAAAFLAVLFSCQSPKSRPEDNYSEEARRLLPSASLTDSVSYLLGVNFAAMLNYGGGGSDGDDFGEIDMQRVKEGIDDFFAADEDGRYLQFLRAGFSGEGYEEFSEQFDMDPALAEEIIGRYLEARLNARGKDNEEKAQKFFEENKEKEGVTEVSVKYKNPKGLDSLKSFVQYQILTPGEGNAIQTGDSLVISYRGRRLGGHAFDAVDSLVVPSFADSLFLPGFSAGLRQLHVGDVATLWIPADMGFRDGRSPKGQPFFSPYAALVFEVTVHDPAKVEEPEEETAEETEDETEAGEADE